MRHDERGAAAVELAIVVPLIGLLLGAMVAGGRLWLARSVVVEAASAAARSASISRGAGEARAAALATAGGQLPDAHCAASAVDVDVSGFAVPVGQPATVTATVTCEVALADVLVPGMPGRVRLTGRAFSPLDTYRERR